MTHSPSTLSLLKKAIACRCPKCGKAPLFKPGLMTLDVEEQCGSCHLDLSRQDCGDGAIFILLFALCILMVPAGIILDLLFSPPLWFLAVLILVLALGITLLAMRPLKSCMIALQYRHRPGDWQEEKTD